MAAFPDGVWFVDLGPLKEAQRVPAAVAATLGLQVGQLTDHLKARRALVVMDNCEHVIGAAVSRLNAARDVRRAKIVATSREVLGTAGEQVFAVRSLSLPATSDMTTARIRRQCASSSITRGSSCRNSTSTSAMRRRRRHLQPARRHRAGDRARSRARTRSRSMTFARVWMIASAC